MRIAARCRRAAVGAALLLATVGGARAQEETLEYSVKATYLYKFIPFVEWPPAAFSSVFSPIVICIVGADPFGALLERAVAGQQFGDRLVAIRRLGAVGPGSGCHILYAAGSPAQSAAEALEAVRGEPVLTVTDGSSTAEGKGVVHFVVLDNRVRFEIDDQAAAEQGLRISSKLLSLASAVRRRT
jgi:hypothetical protein